MMSSESKKAASRTRRTTEADSGTRILDIVGYSLKKGLGVGRFVRSATFTVGGLDWSIRFYPAGNNDACKENAVAILELMSRNTEAHARYALGFVNQDPQMMQMMCQIQTSVQNLAVRGSALGAGLFRFSDATRLGLQNPACMLRSLLELRGGLFNYIVDDCLKIQCDLTVVRVNRAESEIEVPPCDMMQHFGNLLKSKKGVDVAFLVGGETIEAHKIVLAARSPVFMAELLGPMRESGRCCVTVEDMQPEVFRALLHFIYNDSLPDMSDLEENDCHQMMCHLLVAADRYAMDRMKLVCQSTICKNLDVETVATTLALADQHNCDRLRAACIQFIASPKNKDAVAETQGYADLKRTCPSVFIDLFERKYKLAKHG